MNKSVDQMPHRNHMERHNRRLCAVCMFVLFVPLEIRCAMIRCFIHGCVKQFKAANVRPIFGKRQRPNPSRSFFGMRLKFVPSGLENVIQSVGISISSIIKVPQKNEIAFVLLTFNVKF